VGSVGERRRMSKEWERIKIARGELEGLRMRGETEQQSDRRGLYREERYKAVMRIIMMS